MRSVYIAPLQPRRVAAVATAATLAALVLIGQLVDPRAAPASAITLSLAIAVAFTATGTLVLTGVPRHLVGWLMTAAGVISWLAVLAASWSGWLALAWLSQWSWWPPLGLIVLSLLVFPDGQLPSRRWRLLALLIAVATVVATVALAVAALDDPRTLVSTSDRTLTARAQLLERIARVAVSVAGAGLVGVLLSLWARWRRADGETRQQLACLLPAGALFLLTMVLEALHLAGAFVVAAAVVPVAMTIAVLRYHLYGLDRIINRSIVWLVMSLLVILGFVATVPLLRNFLLDGSTSNASMVATGLIVVSFEPLRRWVQHGVDHLLYGDRDDPYKVVARLGDLLGSTMDPNAVLPLLTAEIARSMQVPYVAIEQADSGGPRLLAEHGEPTRSVEAFDMLAHGERIGRLLVAPRSVGGRFTRHERRLLANGALHAAVAAKATQLIRDLQDSRDRLIQAQEKERRRLWRDLHDGVGPALTGMAMQVRAASKCVDEPARVRGLLDGLAADLRSCTAELRELVNQLRPVALDGGLAAALSAECRRFDNTDLSVRLEVAADLDGLPGPIEVATRRIVGEALNNVAKHAKASTCTVTITRDRLLTIKIVDDGIGIRSPRPHGVGLNSMQERAAELGGECFVSAAAPHGTTIRVELPLTSVAKHQTDG